MIHLPVERSAPGYVIKPCGKRPRRTWAFKIVSDPSSRRPDLTMMVIVTRALTGVISTASFEQSGLLSTSELTDELTLLVVGVINSARETLPSSARLSLTLYNAFNQYFVRPDCPHGRHLLPPMPSLPVGRWSRPTGSATLLARTHNRSGLPAIRVNSGPILITLLTGEKHDVAPLTRDIKEIQCSYTASFRLSDLGRNGRVIEQSDQHHAACDIT